MIGTRWNQCTNIYQLIRVTTTYRRAVHVPHNHIHSRKRREVVIDVRCRAVLTLGEFCKEHVVAAVQAESGHE